MSQGIIKFFNETKGFGFVKEIDSDTEHFVHVSGLIAKRRNSMAISSTERRAKNVQVFVEKDAVETSFAKWAQPGHFSRTLAKGPKTTTWIWNLHADAHDFDSQTSSLEEVSRKIFSAHFGQLAIIFLWISGMHFHGAYFSNYSAWLNDPITIKQSSQVVWPIVGQERCFY